MDMVFNQSSLELKGLLEKVNNSRKFFLNQIYYYYNR